MSDFENKKELAVALMLRMSKLYEEFAQKIIETETIEELEMIIDIYEKKADDLVK